MDAVLVHKPAPATTRFKRRMLALALQGTGVGLLVRAEDAAPASIDVDVDGRHSSGGFQTLASYTAPGWTIHPYGPNGFARIDRMLSFLAAKGDIISNTPYYITRWGLTTTTTAARSPTTTATQRIYDLLR